MKKLLCLSTLGAICFFACPGRAQSTAQTHEFAVVKWDGPDRIYYNLPDKFELVHLSKIAVEIPRGAQPEEFCLAWAANKMAKEGWEAVSLDSRRILFRRPLARPLTP
jgi:hypothetical protein